MIKIPRFVREYSNYLKKTNVTKSFQYCIEIDRAVTMLSRGLITVDECMKLLFELKQNEIEIGDEPWT